VKPLRIGILKHEVEGTRQFEPYAIDRLAPFWRQDGHEVFDIYGTKAVRQADVLIVHVDLSVVPKEYVEFTRAYPIVVNGSVTDIRKCTFSTQIVHLDDAWNGPVVVKTNANFGGLPEKVRARPGLMGRLSRALSRYYDRGTLSGRTDRYPIFANWREVPRQYFDSSEFIVERFRPEQDAQGLYCVRTHLFLGDKWASLMLKGAYPIVTSSTAKQVLPVEPHPEIELVRERLGIDYGKLDYAVVNDELILFDVNKTVGCSRGEAQVPELELARRERAEGLYSLVQKHA
jgi:hypothetical protein